MFSRTLIARMLVSVGTIARARKMVGPARQGVQDGTDADRDVPPQSFMATIRSLACAAVLTLLFPAAGGTQVPGPIPSGTTSQVLLDKELVADFTRRVRDYMKLHEKLQKQGTLQKDRATVGENLVSRNALAMRIRFARHDARPGDIFTPPIAMALRRAMDPELRSLAAIKTRQSIRDDAPEVFVLVVNGDYPAGASRATMPGSVLKILPPLPSGLEYRIVDTHLILMDVAGNIVVDYVRDVMCKTC